jgi:hypothetical protein
VTVVADADADADDAVVVAIAVVVVVRMVVASSFVGTHCLAGKPKEVYSSVR